MPVQHQCPQLSKEMCDKLSSEICEDFTPRRVYLSPDDMREMRLIALQRELCFNNPYSE